VIDVFIAFFSLLAVIFAALVLTLRQPMRCALALVSHMICLAGIYAALGAHVIAMFQVLIYVGAVMVFMVYTIMLLDDRDDSYRHPFARKMGLALVAGLGFGGVLLAAISHLATPATAAAAGVDPFTFGAFSLAFMKYYWFHFELATVLLLIGVLAAWTAVKEGL
jgi:NADH-quinone oxidoreductase subunit J